MKEPFILEGWKARVVLTAAIIIIVNLILTVPAFILLRFLH